MIYGGGREGGREAPICEGGGGELVGFLRNESGGGPVVHCEDILDLLNKYVARSSASNGDKIAPRELLLRSAVIA